MARFFIYPFAFHGDKTPIPNAYQPDGTVSYDWGFGQKYEADQMTDPSALDVPRDQFNELMYETTLAIQQYQTLGVPNFITTADNLGTPFIYSKNALARYDIGTFDSSDFRIFVSMVDGNTELPTNNLFWQEVIFGGNPVGTIIMFGGTILQPGYLDATTVGLTVSRTDYARLFAAIGTTWGAGDGSTTFGLPGMAGRVPMGCFGVSDGVIANTVGSKGGERYETLSTDEMPSHGHDLKESDADPGNIFPLIAHAVKTAPSEISFQPSELTGGGQPHNNTPESAIIFYQIKY